MDCIFDKIIAGEIPSDKVYEDGEVIAIKDINPSALVHILIIPKKHIESVNHMDEADSALIGKLIYTASNIAKKKGLSSKGYRLVFNIGEDAGMVVNHIHLHLLGGQKLGAMV
ncbi:MAG: histidine triad nucleotide-binding protein [Actinobacteria bacterium]|nr:MAG: histidine triad nucleotide-binding protein [Actinomycetota bacterium]